MCELLAPHVSSRTLLTCVLSHLAPEGAMAPRTGHMAPGRSRLSAVGIRITHWLLLDPLLTLLDLLGLLMTLLDLLGLLLDLLGVLLELLGLLLDLL